jgi:hypothetical protein
VSPETGAFSYSLLDAISHPIGLAVLTVLGGVCVVMAFASGRR